MVLFLSLTHRLGLFLDSAIGSDLKITPSLLSGKEESHSLKNPRKKWDRSQEWSGNINWRLRSVFFLEFLMYLFKPLVVCFICLKIIVKYSYSWSRHSLELSQIVAGACKCLVCLAHCFSYFSKSATVLGGWGFERNKKEKIAQNFSAAISCDWKPSIAWSCSQKKKVIRRLHSNMKQSP